MRRFNYAENPVFSSLGIYGKNRPSLHLALHLPLPAPDKPFGSQPQECRRVPVLGGVRTQAEARGQVVRDRPTVRRLENQ
jgi:hypothetical protein